MGIVRTKDLVYEYIKRDEDGNVEAVNKAVDNVNIDIEPGQFIAILGHNGSGKSTLAKHINALLLPTEGAVYVEDMSTQDEDKLWDIRQNAGMIFKNPDNQIIGTAYREYSPNKLSGGQKQRVAIAGVVAMKPKCIIMDEPTAMLDPNGRREVINTVMELNRKEKVTIILITHYMDEAAKADKIFVMDKGKVVMEGTPREIFSQVEKMQAIRLDVPQATELAYMLNKSGIPVPQDVLTPEELVDELCRLY